MRGIADNGRRPGAAALRVALAAAAVLAPAALLLDVRANFFYDWHIHQWLVGYFGEYFRQHGSMPETLAVHEAVGMAQPAFYGYLLYPFLGAMSAALGAALAIRVGVALTFAAVFAAVYLAARATLAHRGLSYGIAAATTWSTYALTNLYNRAALPEFFATSFLTAAVGFGAVAVVRVGRAEFSRFGWLAGGFAILAAGTHPPTALISSAFVVVSLGALLATAVANRVRTRAAVRTSLGVAMAGGTILAPWIYANARLHTELGVVGKYRDFSFAPEGCDSWAARFAPLPYDPGTGANPFAGPGTPYLEAPIVFALLVVGAWILIALARTREEARRPAAAERGAAWLAWVALGWTAFMLALSLSPPFAKLFRFLAPYVQFATRFVSHANVGLLVAVLGLGFIAARRGALARYPRQSWLAAAVALAIAGSGLAVKLRHAAVVKVAGHEPQYAWRGERAPLIAPGRPDAAPDYATNQRVVQLLPATVAQAQRANLPVETGADFGRVREAKIIVERAGWVVTNVVAFSWSRLTVNGQDIPPGIQAAHEYRVAMKLPAGEHLLKWTWQPDRVWVILRTISQVASVGLLAAMIWAAWGVRKL